MMAARSAVMKMPKIRKVDVPLQLWPDGTVRVGGTRLMLDTVVTAFQLGSTPDDLSRQFPPFELSDVYAVLAYYLQNKDEVDEYLREGEEEAKRLRAEIQARWPNEGLRERLLARRRQKQADRLSDPPGS